MHVGRQSDGLTLVELVVVTLIVAVLAAVAVPYFLSQRLDAFRAAAVADLRNAASQMDNSAADFGSYPSADDLELQASTGVSLEIVWPPPSGLVYCIAARHARVPTEVWMLSSSEGSVRPGDCT
jgi:type IV pilus assembly protein PilA